MLDQLEHATRLAAKAAAYLSGMTPLDIEYIEASVGELKLTHVAIYVHTRISLMGDWTALYAWSLAIAYLYTVAIAASPLYWPVQPTPRPTTVQALALGASCLVPFARRLYEATAPDIWFRLFGSCAAALFVGAGLIEFHWQWTHYAETASATSELRADVMLLVPVGLAAGGLFLLGMTRVGTRGTRRSFARPIFAILTLGYLALFTVDWSVSPLVAAIVCALVTYSAKPRTTQRKR